MTEPDIESVVQYLDNERIPIVTIIDSEHRVTDNHYLSDDIVQERIDGLFSFDCIIILQSDIERFTEAIGGPFELTSDVMVFAVPCRGYRVWGTTFNWLSFCDESEHREMIEEEGHSITSERSPPHMHDDKELILNLSKVK